MPDSYLLTVDKHYGNVWSMLETGGQKTASIDLYSTKLLNPMGITAAGFSRMSFVSHILVSDPGPGYGHGDIKRVYVGSAYAANIPYTANSSALTTAAGLVLYVVVQGTTGDPTATKPLPLENNYGILKYDRDTYTATMILLQDGTTPGPYYDCQTLYYYNNKLYYTASITNPLNGVTVYNTDGSLNTTIPLQLPDSSDNYNPRNVLLMSLPGATNIWQDHYTSVMFEFAPPADVQPDGTTYTWTDTWPIPISDPITSFTFIQGSFIEAGIDYHPRDQFIVTATTLTSGNINLNVTNTVRGGSSNAKYNCTALVNGNEYHAVLTIEYILTGYQAQ